MRAAEEAITAAMADGRHKYHAGDWLTHSMEEHLDHAGAHLEDLLEAAEMPGSENFRKALAHLICRAVMAWARQEMK